MNLLNKLTLKNLKLNKKRTIVTIIGIMLSVALITAVSTMYSSAVTSLIEFETYEKGNFHVAFFDVPSEDITTLKNNRQIENMYVTKNIGYAKLEESKNEYKPYAYIKAFTKNALDNLSVKLVEGRFPENDKEIVIPTHLKTNGRVVLNIGDTITLDVGIRTSDGEELNQSNPFVEDNNEEIINTVSKTYKIVGIIERPASNIEYYDAPGYTFITYQDEESISGSSELVLYLPPTWNIKSSNEEDYWPIRQLKVLARLPIQCNTWLGYGHTVSSDDKDTPYANNTKFCSMLLLNALNKDYEKLDLRMRTKGKINFYQLFPIYKEELEYKQKNDANTLLDLFSEMILCQ